MRSPLNRPGLPLLLAVLLSTATTSTAEADPIAPGGADCLRAVAQARSLAARERWFDTHATALAVRALCPTAGPWAEVHLWDAIALTALDEPVEARALLDRLVDTADGALAVRVSVASAWLDLELGRREAFAAAVERLPSATRTRLRAFSLIDDGAEFARAVAPMDSRLRSEVAARHRELEASQCARPWLAGTLSAVLPGAGQLYAGSPEGAAIAFAFNAVLIGATVELARRDLYFSAGATGLATSIFYVGNILNAVDLARRTNERAGAAPRRALRTLLLPELTP